ncbi:MAG: hypothetical protein ACLGI5_06215 [Thermoleophilia bacterium]
MHTLAELGPSKLLAAEQETLRQLADTLLFSDGAEAADDAMGDAQILLDGLVSSGRWTQERASRLAEDLAGCGPRITVMR